MKTGMNGMDFLSDEKREEIRVEKRLSAKVRNNECVVLNVSKKGVLLETVLPVFWFNVAELIEFELEIDGEMMPVHGIVKWVASDPEHSRIGIFIKRAPEPYLRFMQEVYS